MSVIQCKTKLTSFDCDEVRLVQFFAGDGICAIVGNVLQNETTLEHMARLGEYRVLRRLA